MGDILYGGKPFFLSALKGTYHLKRNAEELPLMHRVALHAMSLKFKDLKGQPRQFSAAYPKDFRALVTQLEKAGR